MGVLKYHQYQLPPYVGTVCFCVPNFQYVPTTIKIKRFHSFIKTANRRTETKMASDETSINYWEMLRWTTSQRIQTFLSGPSENTPKHNSKGDMIFTSNASTRRLVCRNVHRGGNVLVARICLTSPTGDQTGLGSREQSLPVIVPFLSKSWFLPFLMTLKFKIESLNVVWETRFPSSSSSLCRETNTSKQPDKKRDDQQNSKTSNLNVNEPDWRQIWSVEYRSIYQPSIWFF